MKDLISKELKAVRIRCGFSREQVAQALNVTYETIRKYESGKFNYSVETLENLLNFYKIPVFIFFRNLCENMHEINADNSSI